jgi:integrase/recombinase XerD
MTTTRTPAKKKARELAKCLRKEHPDYAYLKEVFRQLRVELEVTIAGPRRRLPNVPTDEEIRRYYEVVWQTRKVADLVLIKTLLYTGVRVSELIAIKISDVDLDRCQIRINAGKGNKDRVVPFPPTFKETLALHLAGMTSKGATYLFESSWKRKYSDRGVRKMLARYAMAAGLSRTISPHMLRHFLLTWLKKQGIDDALIQPYSGHASRQSLEVYSRLAIEEAQQEYNAVIQKFPV